MVRITVLRIRDNRIEIAGICPKRNKGARHELKILDENDAYVDVYTFSMPYRDVLDDEGNIAAEFRGFRAELPLHEGASYSFVKESHKKNGSGMQISQKKQKLVFGKCSQLQNTEKAYIIAGGCIIRAIADRISVEKHTWLKEKLYESRYIRTLRAEGRSDLIRTRRTVSLAGKSKKKPIVIISDRVCKAGDNGEALFRYLISNGYGRDYEIYYAIKKNSEDYSRMQSVGRVLDFDSEEYKEKFLLADKIISSGFDEWFSDPYGEDMKYMADLYSFDHYFLQHGVIMNDWSRSLNYTRRGFRRFFTTTRRERESLLAEPYGYREEEIVLTGLPRFDLLEDKSEKLIVFLPTWRADLAGAVDRENGSRLYSEALRDSEYCSFYNELINDPGLLGSMKEAGFRGEFYPHPSFAANYTDFHGNDIIKVLRDADYNRVFSNASILITDYSSASMDFAYLGKPVIYSQFDKDAFFSRHRCAGGYFDYERDGFGPVCGTSGETVSAIIAVMNNSCMTDEIYKDRADSFFEYRDRDNCRRVAEAIFGRG